MEYIYYRWNNIFPICRISPISTISPRISWRALKGRVFKIMHIF